MNRKVSILLVLLFSFIFTVSVLAEGIVAIKNSDFEESAVQGVNDWTKGAWVNDTGAVSYIQDDKIFKSGNRSASIINHVPNDSRYKQEVKVQPGRFYKVSCWIKTENVGMNAKGANISVQDAIGSSKDIKGSTGGWELVELYGKAGSDQKSFVLTLGLGGYGSLNTGQAWFDGVSVEELKELPKGVSAVDLYKTNSPTMPAENKNTAANASYHKGLIKIVILYLVALAFVGFIYIAFLPIKSKNKKGMTPSLDTRYFILAVLAVAAVFRLLAAPAVEGHPTDINCFKAWASVAADNLRKFYRNDMFVDYPPAYIYVLYFIGKISKISGLASVQWAYTLLIKLPSLAADIVTAYFIYKIAKGKLSEKWAVLMAGIYAFNPVILLNSTLWGQVDSFFTMLIVIAVWLLMNQKPKWASVVYCIAVLMKPQGIIFLPVLFFELLRKKNIKDFFRCFLYALVTAVIILLPFFSLQDPLWIIKLFINTASGYKGASINAFNFFALLGANWKEDSLPLFLFSYQTWGILFDILILAFSGFLYFKGRGAVLPSIASVVLVTGAFVMSHRMHERYMFPALAILLLAYALVKDRRLLILYGLFSVTSFVNTYMVFSLSLREIFWIPANDPVLFITSLCNVVLMVYLFKTAYDITVKGIIKEDQNITYEKKRGQKCGR